MLPRALFASSLISFVLLSALLQVTSPSSMHPAGILLVYALIYILALGILTLFVYGVLSGLHSILPHIIRAYPIEKAYYIGSVLALLVVVVIAMVSIGRLTTFELILLIIFGLIACVYVSKKH